MSITDRVHPGDDLPLPTAKRRRIDGPSPKHGYDSDGYSHGGGRRPTWHIPPQHPQQHQQSLGTGQDAEYEEEAAADESGNGVQHGFEYEDDMDGEDFTDMQSPAMETNNGTGANTGTIGTPSTSEPASRPTSLDYKLHMTLHGHKRGVAAVKYSPDAKWIASASADCTIKIWDAQTGALVHNLEGHLAGVSTIAWNPDSTVLASGSDDKTIRLWDVTTGRCFPTPLVGHHNYVFSLAFSPKGNMLVSGSYDEAVFLWDVRTARTMRSLPAHSDPVSGVDFVFDGTLVASCSSDGLIRMWDSVTGQCLKTLVHEDNAAVTSVRFSPNGRFVLATTLDSCMRMWDYIEGTCTKTYQGHKNQKYSVNACFGTYNAEGDEDRAEEERQTWAFVACGDEEGKAFIWDVCSKEVMQVLSGHGDVVLGIDVSPSSDAIVTCSKDGTVKVWKQRRGKAKARGAQAENGADVEANVDGDVEAEAEAEAEVETQQAEAEAGL